MSRNSIENLEGWIYLDYCCSIFHLGLQPEGMSASSPPHTSPMEMREAARRGLLCETGPQETEGQEQPQSRPGLCVTPPALSPLRKWNMPPRCCENKWPSAQSPISLSPVPAVAQPVIEGHSPSSSQQAVHTVRTVCVEVLVQA